MEVKVNSKKKILKSFMGWLPLVLVAGFMYGAMFALLIMWLLKSYAGFGEEQARHISWVFGAVFFFVGGYFYLNMTTKSLSSYKLALRDDSLIIAGKNGWKSLDTEIPVSSISKLYLGQQPNTAEKLSAGHGVIQDQVASRLTFLKVDGSTFKLDFAAKAFDIESLCDFLILIKSKGIETNIVNKWTGMINRHDKWHID